MCQTVIIVNGYPCSGKSTFVELCKEIAKDEYEVYEYSTVDFVKAVATTLGWDGRKTLADRKFLSDLKDALTQWKNIPFEKSIEFIASKPKDAIVFIHCREPKEIQKFKDYYGTNCITVFIQRDAVQNNTQSNHADSEVANFNYDKTIQNNGNLIDLKEAAKTFLYQTTWINEGE